VVESFGSTEAASRKRAVEALDGAQRGREFFSDLDPLEAAARADGDLPVRIRRGLPQGGKRRGPQLQQRRLRALPFVDPTPGHPLDELLGAFLGDRG
jgi:hypothetical protein